MVSVVVSDGDLARDIDLGTESLLDALLIWASNSLCSCEPMEGVNGTAAKEIKVRLYLSLELLLFKDDIPR